MSPDTGTFQECDSDMELRRLNALRSYCIVDTAPDPALDALTRSATRIFDVPVSLIALIDSDRQFFKSRQGINFSETPRSTSFCNKLIEDKKPLILPDASKDPYFKNNPYVTDYPHIRFYSSTPLIDRNGQVLGSFCIIDTKPRDEGLSDDELAILQAFAAETVDIISDNYPYSQVEANNQRDPAQMFRSFIRDVPMAAAMIDRDMNYLAVSDEWYQVFGFEERNILGQNHFDCFPNLSSERREFYRSVLDFGATESGIEELCAKVDGTPLWLRCHSLPWYAENGEIGGILLYRAEIEDEIHARNMADRTQRLLETFFYHNPAHMYVKTLSGEYQLYNKAFSVGFGVEPDQQGLTAADVLPDEAASQFEAIDREVLRTGGVVKGAIDVVIDGELKNRFDVSKFPVLNDDGEILAIGGVSIDITEGYKSEQALRQAQKMEAVGNLTGGIAHDFNNILAVILGNLQLMQRRIADDSKESERLTGAMNATLRGASLTKQLLAFSRRQELEPSVIDVNDTLNELHNMVSRTLSETIDIELLLSDDLPNAFIDEGQFQNCVLNLSINARDAMPDGGMLQIESKHVFIDDDELAGLDGLSAGEYVVVSITDDGCGMSKEVRERVFEPFFTTKGVGKGTGLGLAMVYGFIKQSQGHVTVYSEVGYGTTIRMYLPVATSDSEVEETAPVQAAENAVGKILVVEDDDAVRAIVQAMLEDIGYETEMAATGAEAVNMLSNGVHYDLVFSDVIMPGGMTGVDLAQIIAQRWPEIPVLLTSGYPRDAVKSKVAVHILPKPYQQHELASEIGNAMAKHKDSSS